MTVADAPGPARPRSARVWWWITGAAIAALYIAPLPWFGLSEPDEARYAEIAREMLESGDWVTPRLNHVKYFEKPPLAYWATAIAQGRLGPGEFSNRVFPAACGLLTVVLAFVLARDMFGVAVARYAATILAASPLFFAMSQVLTLDIPLAFGVTLALSCFWFGYTRPARRAWWYRGMYAAVAAGVLIKGPVAAVLSGLAVALFLALRREWREMVAVLRPDGLALAAAIVLPWFALVSLRNPEFPWFFFVHEHWQRYTSTGEHREPWWFYAPVVVGGMAPWTLMAVGDARKWWETTRRLYSPGQLFCAAWTLSMLLFFSISVSKLGTYTLPVFPPLAVLIAAGLREQVREGRSQGLRLTAAAAIGVGVACAVASIVVSCPGLVDPRARPAAAPAAAGGAVLIGVGIAMRRLLAGGRVPAAFRVLTGGFVAFLGVVISGRGVVAQYRELAHAAAAAAGPDGTIVSYGYVQGLPFYTGRRVICARSWGELEFGRRQEDSAAFFWPDDRQVVEAWGGEGRIVMVIDRREVERLRSSLVPAPIEIAAQGKKVAVANRAP